MFRRHLPTLLGPVRISRIALCATEKPWGEMTTQERAMANNAQRHKFGQKRPEGANGPWTTMRDLGDPANLEKHKHDRPRVNSGVLNPIESANYLQTELQGTWRDNRDLKDFLSKDELSRFMTIKEAGKRLNIEESSLAKLTPDSIEKAWSRAYEAAKNPTEQLELSAAAETLLGYLETSTHKEVLAAHNRKVMNDFKQEMARRKSDETNKIYTNATMVFGVSMVGVGVVLLAFMYYLAVTREMTSMDKIWDDVYSWMCFSMGNPSGTRNPGEAPDYTTRYRDTKTALDEHLESVETTLNALDPLHQDILEAKAVRDREEERLVVKIYNEVVEESLSDAKEQRLAASRVRVIRKEDLENLPTETHDIVLKNGLVLSPMRELTWESFKNYCWSMMVMTIQIKANAKPTTLGY